MPPTKVCPQCKAAVPVRRKTCERCNHVFQSRAKCNLREKAMKCMRTVESDSVKSARKAKDKLHKPFNESQKLLSKLYTGTKTMRVASMSHETVIHFLVSTQVQSHALLRRGFGTSVPFILSVGSLFFSSIDSMGAHTLHL